MESKTIKLLAFVGAFFGVAASSHAGLIDLTQASPQSLTGTVDGVSYVVSANGPITTNNTLLEQQQVGQGTCAGGLACVTDGFGIGSGGNSDEVNGAEQLTISFTDGTVQVQTLFVLDLYTSANGNDRESGEYSFDGVNWTSFFADPSEVWNGNSTTTNGWLAIGVNATNFVSQIMFRSASGNDSAGVGDYAVAGVLTSQGRTGVVPLPGAAWLMLSALGGAGLLRRRKSVA